MERSASQIAQELHDFMTDSETAWMSKDVVWERITHDLIAYASALEALADEVGRKVDEQDSC